MEGHTRKRGPRASEALCRSPTRSTGKPAEAYQQCPPGLALRQREEVRGTQPAHHVRGESGHPLREGDPRQPARRLSRRPLQYQATDRVQHCRVPIGLVHQALYAIRDPLRPDSLASRHGSLGDRTRRAACEHRPVFHEVVSRDVSAGSLVVAFAASSLALLYYRHERRPLITSTSSPAKVVEAAYQYKDTYKREVYEVTEGVHGLLVHRDLDAIVLTPPIAFEGPDAVTRANRSKDLAAALQAIKSAKSDDAFDGDWANDVAGKQWIGEPTVIAKKHPPVIPWRCQGCLWPPHPPISPGSTRRSLLGVGGPGLPREDRGHPSHRGGTKPVELGSPNCDCPVRPSWLLSMNRGRPTSPSKAILRQSFSGTAPCKQSPCHPTSLLR